MEFKEYMDAIEHFDLYPEDDGYDRGFGFYGVALGLVSEVGELAGKFSKELRGDDVKQKDIEAEMGDVFWYLATLCRRMDISPSYIMQMNVEKLTDRLNREALRGNGDNR